MRKRIGVLLAQLEENTQKKFMTAFMKEAYAHDYDICVFSMYQKYQDTELRNIGDSNIYNLIQYDLFDGIVIMLDTILYPNLAEQLEKEVKEKYNGPVIVVDRESQFFETVMIDHYTPVMKIVDHLLEEHEYKKLAFFGGKEGHPHSIQRLNGFLDSMKAHGIPIREDWIFIGNYWYDTGHNNALKLLENRDDLPEVVVCANDAMAIGAAAEFSANGLRIPEDIAIVGYDSTEEGKLSPIPLTSAEIPAGQCGKYCFYRLHTQISGEEMPVLKLSNKMVYGGSCGCTNYNRTYTVQNRLEWKTDRSEASFFSDFNHIMEDMIGQKDVKKLLEMIACYAYQIRPYHHFWMCLNSGFEDPLAFVGEDAISHGYSDEMNMVIELGNGIEGADGVDLNRKFDSSILIPALLEERDYPTSFVFTPMFFDNRSFGYVCMNQGPDPYIYNRTFRMWMRNVNQGIESFYRQKAYAYLIDQIKAEQIRDSLTGLYNYQGFRQQLLKMIDDNKDTDKELTVAAFDIGDLRKINEEYGREAGDQAICSLAKFISLHCEAGTICGRLCNDEFLFGVVGNDSSKALDEVISHIPEEGIKCRLTVGETIRYQVYHGVNTYDLHAVPDIDYVINQTVNVMGHVKQELKKMQSAYADLSPEMVEKCHAVEKVLNENLLTYYFQPIVSGKNGKVYGYEALMRYEGTPNLTPFDVLSCATIIDKMDDVEKGTFNGVLDIMDKRKEEFEGKKVFINSIPGHQLYNDDGRAIFDRIKNYKGQIIIEYTEESEISDEKLALQKDFFEDAQIRVALDDYGSGYSNVNNLLRYNPKVVKIDRMLVSEIDTNSQKLQFVKNIVEYGRSNNIIILAEGVETSDELRTLIGMGVDLIQGYYTGRPVKDPVQAIDPQIEKQIRSFYAQRDSIGFFV